LILKNKLALVALLPLLALVAVPVATIHAAVPNVEIWVHCNTEEAGPAAGASIAYAGKSVIVMCPPTLVDKVAFACVYVSASTKFTSTTFAGGLRHTTKGSFGPSDGAIYGEQYSPFTINDQDSYAEWFLGAAVGSPDCTPV
jgi:hypothetical protein